MTSNEWIGKHLADPKACPHDWQPVSFVFEIQLLGHEGRVEIRQPDTEAGQVYLVCLGCAQHTYIETSWAQYRLEGSPDRKEVLDKEENEGENTIKRDHLEDIEFIL